MQSISNENCILRACVRLYLMCMAIMACIKLSSKYLPKWLLLSIAMLWCLNIALAAQDSSELLKTIEIFYYSPYVCKEQQSKSLVLLLLSSNCCCCCRCYCCSAGTNPIHFLYHFELLHYIQYIFFFARLIIE